MPKLKILNVVGARPNFMKIAPIQRVMERTEGIEPILIHTGQHYDKKMSDLFFNDLELPKPDVFLGIGSGSHAVQTAKVMIEFEKVCLEYKPDVVVVVGDVNSTAACSIVATKLHIPVVHVEAGLRSFDRRMPEEINRIITDAISDHLFVTEQSGINNLKNEGINSSKVSMVGHVMIDTLIHLLDKAEQSRIMEELKVEKQDFVLVTLHRPSNVDNEENFTKIADALIEVQKSLPIIFPIHPRTEKNMANYKVKQVIDKLENFIILPPIGYLDFIKLQSNARFIITDSGGIQEESTYMGIPCLTARETTERPVTCTLGTNEIVGTDTEKIIRLSRQIIAGHWKKGQIPPLWDGHSAERIVEVLVEKYS